MTSPVTYLDCSKYAKARIRMIASAPTATEATGQFFWSTTEHGVGEERSVSFKVQLDGKWRDYELDLKSNPNWKGLTDRLRLDPVNLAGVEISVDEIRLIKSN